MEVTALTPWPPPLVQHSFYSSTIAPTWRSCPKASWNSVRKAGENLRLQSPSLVMAHDPRSEPNVTQSHRSLSLFIPTALTIPVTVPGALPPPAHELQCHSLNHRRPSAIEKLLRIGLHQDGRLKWGHQLAIIGCVHSLAPPGDPGNIPELSGAGHWILDMTTAWRGVRIKAAPKGISLSDSWVEDTLMLCHGYSVQGLLSWPITAHSDSARWTSLNTMPRTSPILCLHLGWRGISGVHRASLRIWI